MNDSQQPTNEQMAQAVQSAQRWGHQTVAFAMTVKAHNAGTPVAGQEQLQATWGEAMDHAKRMWEAAIAQAQQGDAKGDAILLYAKEVLGWASEQIAAPSA